MAQIVTIGGSGNTSFGAGHTSSTVYELSVSSGTIEITGLVGGGTPSISVTRCTKAELETGLVCNVSEPSIEFATVSIYSGVCAGAETALAYWLNAPTPTPTPTPVTQEPTPTPTPEVATPTPTPEVATPTPTPEVATPTPTPTPTPEVATPTPTPTPTPECLTYDVHNYDLVNSVTFGYTDCNGDPNAEFTLNKDSDYYICAQTVPVRISGTNSYAVDTPGYVDTQLCPPGGSTPAQPTPTPTPTPVAYQLVRCSDGNTDFYHTITNGSSPAYGTRFYSSGLQCYILTQPIVNLTNKTFLDGTVLTNCIDYSCPCYGVNC